MSDRPSRPIPIDVERLCRLYDDRLARAGGTLAEADAQELRAMAGIYDLNTDRPPAEVWRDLRAVITREAPLAGDSPEAGDPLTLMVVEDDAEAAAALTELLTDAGHRVVGPFHNAAAAEAAAALHPIDAALLDINLSDENEASGVGLARNLSRRWDTRILFLSGDVKAAAGAADLAERLLLKPYTGAEVLRAVADLTRA